MTARQILLPSVTFTDTSLPVLTALPGVTPLLHIRADDLAGAAGSDVTAWTGRAGGVGASTGATAPKIGASTLNGHKTVLFNGTDQRLDWASFTASGNTTEVMVAKLSTPGTGGAIGSTTSNTAAQRRAFGGLSGTYWQAQCGTGSNLVSAVAFDANWHVMGVTYADATSRIRIGNTDLAGTLTSSTASRTGLRLGGAASGSYTPQEVAEFIVFPGRLTDADWSGVFAYLASRYAL